LGTDLLWDHESDGRLFRMNFVMASFFSGNVFNANVQSSWRKYSVFAPMDGIYFPVLHFTVLPVVVEYHPVPCAVLHGPPRHKGLRNCCNSERPATSTPKTH
jgi:hypothetical protein